MRWGDSAMTENIHLCGQHYCRMRGEMKLVKSKVQRSRSWHIAFKLAGAVLFVFVSCGIVNSQRQDSCGRNIGNSPEGEFHMARVIYPTSGGGGSHGCSQPWWGIDYPLAEGHFLPALRRMANMSVADDSIQLELTDDRIFRYPFLFLQQPGAGYWNPTAQEAANLRQHLLRGGFLLVDDLHGERDWDILADALHVVFPDRDTIEIPDDDAIMHSFFDLDRTIQVPGDRHVRFGGVVQGMAGPPHWRGIYDDKGHLMVAINLNMDMGDGWEHADDPNYPAAMTAQAYKLGVNYVIYSMSH